MHLLTSCQYGNIFQKHFGNTQYVMNHILGLHNERTNITYIMDFVITLQCLFKYVLKINRKIYIIWLSILKHIDHYMKDCWPKIHDFSWAHHQKWVRYASIIRCASWLCRIWMLPPNVYRFYSPNQLSSFKYDLMSKVYMKHPISHQIRVVKNLA